jgi:hypothetical protein
MFKRLFVLSGALVCLTGCFEMNHKLDIGKKLDGVYAMEVKMDMEPMAYTMSMLQHAMAGNEGDMTVAQFEEYKAAMQGDMQEKLAGDLDEAKMREEISANVPKGLTLNDVSVAHEDMSFTVALSLGFDNLKTLASFKTPGMVKKSEDGEAAEDADQPLFKEFELGKGKKGAKRMAVWLSSPNQEGSHRWTSVEQATIAARSLLGCPKPWSLQVCRGLSPFPESPA